MKCAVTRLPSFSLLLFAALVALTPRASAQGGVPLWTNWYGEVRYGDDGASGIAVDNNGDVFVTGPSWNGTSYDYATVAYSGAGIALWTNRYHGPSNGDDRATAITVWSNSIVVVTGFSPSSNSSFSGDYATLAYSIAGVPLWTNRYDGPGNRSDTAYAVAVDSTGNVIVTGFSMQTNGSPYNYDYATVAYSRDGVSLWTNRYDGTGHEDGAMSVVVDKKDNVFVTGRSAASDTPPLNYDYATVAYSKAGVPLWTNRYNGAANGDDYARSIAVSDLGDVIVTGYSSGSGGYFDYATVAYSGTGVPLWTNRYNGPGDNDDFASAMAVDIWHNVFVTGYSYNSTNNVSSDYATVAYSGTGTPLWTNRYNGPANANDYATDIAVDRAGNVFVTGSSYDPYNADYVTIAYSGAGVGLWTNRCSLSVQNTAIALAVDPSGNIFVTGSSYNGDSYYDFATIKYSSSIPPAYLNFQLLNNELVLSWTNSAFSLQIAPASTGTFTNLTSATSPYTNPITATQQFFRLKKN